MTIFVLLAYAYYIVISSANVANAANAATDNAFETSETFLEAEKSFLFSPRGTYKHYCAPCHGEMGEGDGTYYSTDLTPTPRDLTDEGYMSTRSDADLFNWIKDGSAASGKSNLCSPWGHTLSEETIRNLIGYVRSLSFRSEEKLIAKETFQIPSSTSSISSKISKQAISWKSISDLILFPVASLFIVVGICQWRRNRRIRIER